MKAQRSQPDAAPLGFENTGKWPAAENNRPPRVCVHLENVHGRKRIRRINTSLIRQFIMPETPNR